MAAPREINPKGLRQVALLLADFMAGENLTAEESMEDLVRRLIELYQKSEHVVKEGGRAGRKANAERRSR